MVGSAQGAHVSAASSARLATGGHQASADCVVDYILRFIDVDPAAFRNECFLCRPSPPFPPPSPPSPPSPPCPPLVAFRHPPALTGNQGRCVGAGTGERRLARMGEWAEDQVHVCAESVYESIAC